MATQRASSMVSGVPDSKVAVRKLPPAVLSVIDQIAPLRKGVAEAQQFVQGALIDQENEVKKLQDGNENKLQQLNIVRQQIASESKKILDKGYREKKEGVNYNNLLNGAQRQILSLEDGLYLQCYLYVKQTNAQGLAGLDLYLKVRDLHNNGNPDPKLMQEITAISLADHTDAVNQFIKTVSEEYLSNQKASAKLIFQKHIEILWQQYREEKTDSQVKNMLGDIFLRACEKFPEYCDGFKVAVKIKDDKQLKENLKKLKALMGAPEGVTQLQENLKKMSDDNAVVFINIQMTVKLLLDVMTLIKNFKAKTTEEKEVIGDWLKPMEGVVGQLTEKNAADLMKGMVINLQTAMSKLTYKSVLRDQLQQVLTVNCKLLADDVALLRRGDPAYQKEQWASVVKWCGELKKGNAATIMSGHAIDAVILSAEKKENEQKRDNAIPVLEVINDFMKLPGRYDKALLITSMSAVKGTLLQDALFAICQFINTNPLDLYEIYQKAAVVLKTTGDKIEKEGTLKDMIIEMRENYEKLAKLHAPKALAEKAVDQTAEVQGGRRSLGRSSADQ